MAKRKHRKSQKIKSHHIAFAAGIFVAIIIAVLLLPGNDDSLLETVMVTDITLTGSNLSFTVQNNRDMPADCIADANGIKYNMEVIGPMSNKHVQMFYDTVIPMEMTVTCEWEDISGCDGTSFYMCNLYNTNDQIVGCRDNNLAYQHFCAALILQESSICDHIIDEPRMTHCKAYIEKKPELCGTLGSGRDWCYQDYAMNTGRVDLCNQIIDESMKESCRSVLGADLESCKESTDNMACITHFVDRKQDKSLCEFASKPQECYSSFNNVDW